MLRRLTVFCRYLSSGKNRHLRSSKTSVKRAFPIEFDKRIIAWKDLIQHEITASNSADINGTSSKIIGDVRFIDYTIDASSGHVANFRLPSAARFAFEGNSRAIPVTLIENGEKVNRYECIVIGKDDGTVKLKFRGAYGSRFVPQVAEFCSYSLLPSTEFGNLQVIQEFLKARNKWEKFPGFPIMEVAYRAKPTKTVFVDRKLKYFQKLNQSQKQAVNAALNYQRPLVCIQGPPGTGKTRVLTEIILQANHARLKVLICAPSNQATDNLMQRVQKHLGDVYRATETSASNAAECSSIDSAMQHHSDFDALVQLYSELTRKKYRTSNVDEIQKIANEANKLRNRIKSSVVGASNIIFTTLMSVSVRTLRSFGFSPDIVIIEEAGQAMECASWMALLQAPRAVLAGDPRQLGAVVKSREAADGGLQNSLMEFVQKEHGSSSTIMLHEQYRMNSAIQQWSSASFYDNKLRPSADVEDITLSDLDEGFAAEQFSPMVFVDTDELNDLAEESSVNSSYLNKVEAKVVIEHVNRLFEHGLKVEQMGVITPYSAQVNLIRSQLKSWPGLVISSVDAFQGEEREAIIMSLVRSNPENAIGFLSDLRRMNVSVTRARRHMFLIGSSRMLKSHPVLRSLVDVFHNQGVVYTPRQYFNLGGSSSNRNSPKRVIQFLQ